MIDLFLWAADMPTITTFAQTYGLFVEDTEGNWTTRSGVAWTPWAGTGKVLRTPGSYSAEGDELAPPTYLDGTVVIVRLYGEAFEADRLEAVGEQWQRSKLVRRLHDEGVLGEVLGLSFFELAGVRVGHPGEVNAKLAEWGVPGHTYAGGMCP